MKLETKKTEMECTKRIRFIAGVCIKEESTDVHSSVLTDRVLQVTGVLADGILEIKKQLTFEQGTNSKVLIMHNIEFKANRVD